MTRIRDAALSRFAAYGAAASSLRHVAETAGVSIGLVQHYFGTKDRLVDAVNDYVLQVVGEAIEGDALPRSPEDPLAEAGRRVTALIAEHSDVVDYLSRALIDGEDFGAAIFDGLLAISAAQRDEFTERGLIRADLDPVWAALNPLILRVGAIVLRAHIDRHLPAPFTTPAQLQRWDAAMTELLRVGQLADRRPPEVEQPPR